MAQIVRPRDDLSPNIKKGSFGTVDSVDDEGKLNVLFTHKPNCQPINPPPYVPGLPHTLFDFVDTGCD